MRARQKNAAWASLVLAVMVLGPGCATAPGPGASARPSYQRYERALEEAADGLHDAIGKAGELYGKGKLNDAEKEAVLKQGELVQSLLSLANLTLQGWILHDGTSSQEDIELELAKVTAALAELWAMVKGGGA